MWSLIRKEWRDYRALMLGFLVLPPLVSLALRWFVIGWPGVSHLESVAYIVPGFFTLFVVAVAADLIAGDTGSGRVRFLAALPVRPTTVWFAKLLFLVATASIFFGYLVAVEWLLLGAAGKDVARFFPDLTRSAPVYAVIAAGGAAVLLGSTLLDRSLSAVLAGAALLAAVAAAIAIYDPTRFGLHYRVSMLAPLALALVPAFLVASYLSFTRGRVHLGSRLRRVALAAVGFLAIATAPAVVSARALEAWWHVSPSDTDVRWTVSPLTSGVTPDGRWLVAGAGRPGRGPFGVWPHRGSVFAVRLEDGIVRDLTGLGFARGVEPGESYPAVDQLRLVRYERDASLQGQTALLVDYDLGRGRVSRTRVHPRPHLLQEFRMPHGPWLVERRWVGEGRDRYRSAFVVRTDGETLIPRGWFLRYATAPWGCAVYRLREGQKRVGFRNGILTFATGEVREVKHLPRMLPTRPDGEALSVDSKGRGILAVPLDGRPARRVLEARYRASALSPDGTRFVVATDRGLFRFRSDRAEPQRIGAATDFAAGTTILWSRDGRTFLVVSGGRARRGTREGDTLAEFGNLDEARPIWFDGERAITKDASANRIFVVDAEGTRQLLPTPK